jgi:hypothetical protein
MQAARCAGTLVSVALAIVPSVVSAQDATGTAGGITDPAKLRLFLDVPPPSTTLWTGPPKSTDFLNPPTIRSDVPQWTIQWKALIEGPRGSAFSAGFIGQRGNPMPVYWSQGAASLSASRSSITGPGTYRDQGDLVFGVRSPALTIGRVKVTAFGEMFVPVSPRCPYDPASSILNSSAIRFGIMAMF